MDPVAEPTLACRAGSTASPVLRALWFIEDHLAEEVCLDDIAQAGGVSRFQLSRAFVAVTGWPVMQYVRNRRLTEAARALAAGAPDILSVALDWGYGSHEAFTRAFCGHFGLTPERLRTLRSTRGLPLTEALVMNESRGTPLTPPRLEQGRPLIIAGLGARYTFETNLGIPALWQRFIPRIPQIPHVAGPETYGVCCTSDGDGSFDYVAGVEVSDIVELPSDMRHVVIPAQQFAVFTHRGHVSGIRDTVHSIWNQFLPQSSYWVISTPDFERYGRNFDPATGNGEVEIWIPVEASR